VKALLPLALSLLLQGKSPDVEAPPRVWSRLPPPREGEWLSIFREPGETFAEYRAKRPVRGEGSRKRIYLLPAFTRPPEDPEALAALASLLAGFFGRECAVRLPEPLPIDAFRMERRQFDVARLLPALERSLPDDALFLLAVTDRDLYLGGLTHLFGWASMDRRCGIVSTARIARGAPPRQFRRRLLALAAHECSHMLSLAHCTFYRCLMNGSYDLAESDRRPFLLCPVCREKLCWNLGLDRKRRYQTLAARLESLGLPEEAAAERAALSTCD